MCQSDFGAGLTPRRGHQTRITKDSVPQDRQRCCQWSEWLLQADCVWLACDCQQTYKCSSQLNALHLIHSGEKSYYVCLCCRAGQLNSNCAVYQLVRVVCLFSGFTACVVAGLYVGMSVCLCSLDSPLAQSVFIEQPPQIPTIAKLPAQTHRQYASQ